MIEYWGWICFRQNRPLLRWFFSIIQCKCYKRNREFSFFLEISDLTPIPVPEGSWPYRERPRA